MDHNGLADLIAKRFIARTDVKAEQLILRDGRHMYQPQQTPDKSGYIKWTRADLLAHLSGEKSYGHYMVNLQNKCKLFAFDIDLEKAGFWSPTFSDPWKTPEDLENPQVREFNPRDAWRDRGHCARPQLKFQLKSIAHACANAIYTELDIPVAAYYSGSKGVHVYGFTGLVDAYEARMAAKIALESMECWIPKRGDSCFEHKDKDALVGFPNFSLEVYPKQDTVGASGFGNLMRLPLGRNLKNLKDPTFFLDLKNTDMGSLARIDPEFALTADNPWTDQ